VLLLNNRIKRIKDFLGFDIKEEKFKRFLMRKSLINGSFPLVVTAG